MLRHRKEARGFLVRGFVQALDDGVHQLAPVFEAVLDAQSFELGVDALADRLFADDDAEAFAFGGGLGA